MENFYKMIGTSQKAIKHKRLELEKRKDLKKEKIDEYLDIFVKEKYEDVLRIIQKRKKIYEKEILNFEQDLQDIEFVQEQKKRVEEKILQLEQQEIQITHAYKQIATQNSRDLYDFMVNKSMTKKRRKIIDFETYYQRKNEATAYEFLNVLEESFQIGNEEENNRRLFVRKKELLKGWIQQLETEKDFITKVKIETIIKKIEEAYELIKTEEERRKYAEELRKKRKESEEQLRIERKERDIKNKYSHNKEYDPSLIFSTQKANQEDLWKKAVMKKSIEGQTYYYEDEARRNLEIRKIGEISFLNSGRGNVFVNAYEITRIVEGEERKDIVYTNSIKPAYLSIDKETGEPMYPEYYHCVVNKLISEDAIEGSKYNGGYIGKIEKDEEGNYRTTLGNEKLRPEEQEYLTAVMIIKKREKMELEKDQRKGAQR